MLTSRGTRSGFQYEGGGFFCKHAGGCESLGREAGFFTTPPLVEMTSFWMVWSRTGLECVDDGGFCGGDFAAVGARFFFLGLQDGFEELGDGAFAFCGLSYFGGWSEDA